MNKINLPTNFLVLIATAVFAIFVGSKLPYLFEKWRGPFTEGNYRSHVMSMPHKLTLYGTRTCEHCIAARAYLRQLGVQFNDLLIDESESTRNKFVELKRNAVPILVSSERIVVGFNEENYKKFVKLADR